MDPDDKPSSKSSRSVERGIRVLDALSKAEREISLAELSHNVDLHQSTVYRILTAFKKFGYVDQNNQNSKYRLGPMVFSLSDSFMRANEIHDLVFEELTKLRDYCGETVHYAVRSGNEVVYVEKIQGIHPVGVLSNSIGQRNPLHCTAVGKTLLAWLPVDVLEKIIEQYPFTPRTPYTIVDPQFFLEELGKIKATGYAENREEIEIGVAAIASPVFDRAGVVGAVSITAPVGRLSEIMDKQDMVGKLIETCAMVSTYMIHRIDDLPGIKK